MTSSKQDLGRALSGKELAAFAERLEGLIQRAGFATVKEFCAAAGVAESTVSRIRSGARGTSVPNLTKMAAALRVTLDELLGQEPEVGPRDAEPWVATAIANGHDPDDPEVREVYSTAFLGAMGAASQFASAELARRKAERKGKTVVTSREVEDGEF